MSDAKRIDRYDWPWLLTLMLIGILSLAVFYVAAWRFTNGQGGVPLDDAWIHFQFARNVARGNGISFNAGQPISGSTAPLWTLLLSALYLAGCGFPLAGQVLSAVGLLTATAATYALSKRLTGSRWAAWLAAIVVSTSGRMVWASLSALETSLFTTLSLLAIGAYLTDRGVCRYRFRTAALLGLAAQSRPEGYLLFVLSLADFLFAGVLCGGGLSRRLWKRVPLLPMALFGVIVLPSLLFSLRTSGHLLPNTFHAKSIITLLPDLDFISIAARYLILDNPVMLPFFIVGLAVLFRRATVLSLWVVGLPLAYSFLGAVLYQHGRYLIPLIPCNAIAGVLGLLEGRRIATTRSPRVALWITTRRSIALLVTLVLLGAVSRLPHMATQYAWNVHNINQMHVALGLWVVEHTAPNAVLALNDIGAITYISQRSVIDLAGLVTPDIIPILGDPDRDERLVEYLAERNADYVVVFPNWFAGLASRDDVLEEVHRVALDRNTVAGGDTMIVFRTHWRGRAK